MLDKEELLKTRYYEHPYQKEKDYLQELFLERIYRTFDELVFKGGTALSKFYGSIRFSDDLDFSLLPKREEKMIAARLAEMIDDISKDYPIKVLREKSGGKMLTYEISIRGPLFDTLNKYQHLKIEIDRKASLIEQPRIIRRNPLYKDLRPYVAIVQDETEILAEKIVALLFRHTPKARDLYDIYFLVKKGTEIKVGLIDKKMREYGHTFTEKKLLDRMHIIDKIWKKELLRLLPESEFLQYGKAESYILEQFRMVGLC